MTESEWLACNDPERMLDFLRGRVGDRKLRLFACACCRHYAQFGDDAELREAVALAERHADGMLSQAEYPRYNTFQHHSLITGVARGISQAPGSGWGAAYRCALNAACGNPREAGAQSSLLRCIVGNPFCPASFDPAWCAPAVVALAQAIYEEHAFERMPKLADALQQTGCDSEVILGHCRSTGPHARGCWVVDLLLGKE